MRDLDLDLLRAFVAIVDCRSLSRAAERLNRNQSTVSQQLKRLEERLGATLLDRSPRRMDLTAEGEAILDHARRLLALNDEIVERIQEPKATGVVRLGAPEDFATTHLPDVLARFARAHPQIALEVTCELTVILCEKFSAGELDLALVKREPGANVVVRGRRIEVSEEARVWREPLIWVAGERRRFLQDEAVPLVVSPRPCVYRDRAVKALEAAGLQWRVAYTCGALAGAQAAVRAGLGVAPLPKEMAPADLFALHPAAAGLPELADTEIVLLSAPDVSRPVELLSEFVVAALEHPR